MNYLNEWDSFAAQWCRNLIAAGEIPEAIVDERSIREVTADEVRGYSQCHWFGGIAGWPLALRLAGVDPTSPLWTASCPCQPFSAAGKRKGTEDERHLWPVLFNLIRECCPGVLVGEQVASKDGLGWLDGVFADLEGEGYACWATDTCAAGIGAPHIRQRLFWVAIAECPQRRTGGERGINEQYGQDAIGGKAAGGSRIRGEPNGLAIAQRFGERESRGVLSSEPTGGDARDDASFGSESCWLGHAEADGRRQRSAERTGSSTGIRAEGDGCGPADAGESCGVGHTEGERLSGDTTQPRTARGWDGGQSCVAESVDGLGHAVSAGPQGHWRGVRAEPGDGADRQPPATAGGWPGPWSDYLVIPCRDGKYRRVGRGVQPLAHGLPRRVGQELAGLGGLGALASDHEIREAGASLRRAKRNRVGRLKGYGNAIVPYLAAEFVRTAMEILDNADR